MGSCATDHSESCEPSQDLLQAFMERKIQGGKLQLAQWGTESKNINMQNCLLLHQTYRPARSVFRLSKPLGSPSRHLPPEVLPRKIGCGAVCRLSIMWNKGLLLDLYGVIQSRKMDEIVKQEGIKHKDALRPVTRANVICPKQRLIIINGILYMQGLNDGRC